MAPKDLDSRHLRARLLAGLLCESCPAIPEPGTIKSPQSSQKSQIGKGSARPGFEEVRGCAKRGTDREDQLHRVRMGGLLLDICRVSAAHDAGCSTQMVGAGVRLWLLGECSGARRAVGKMTNYGCLGRGGVGHGQELIVTSRQPQYLGKRAHALFLEP